MVFETIALSVITVLLLLLTLTRKPGQRARAFRAARYRSAERRVGNESRSRRSPGH